MIHEPSRWWEYLEARIKLISEWDEEGRTEKEIYSDLLVDPIQVRLLILTARERRVKDQA